MPSYKQGPNGLLLRNFFEETNPYDAIDVDDGDYQEAMLMRDPAQSVDSMLDTGYIQDAIAGSGINPESLSNLTQDELEMMLPYADDPRVLKILMQKFNDGSI